MIKLKISEKEKYASDGQWFKDYLDETVPINTVETDDYKAMLTSYRVVNSDLSDFKEMLNKFCNPLGEDFGEIDEEIQPYPELHNAINILKGEVIQRKDQLHLTLLTAQAIREKNQPMLEQIRLSVDEKLGIELQKMEAQMQGMDEQQIDEMVKSLRTQLEPEDLAQKNWLSEVEIFYNKALKYCEFDQKLMDKKVETMSDLATADRFFIFSGWKHGRPFLDVRNPIHIDWHKSPNQKLVHKSNWIRYQRAVTLLDAIEAYDLSDDEIERLDKNRGRGLDKRHSLGKDNQIVFDHTKQDLLISQSEKLDREIGLSYTPNSTTRNNILIWETHFEFKAFKELIFLTYKDEYGEPITLTLDSSFEIPSSAKKEKFMNRYDQKSTKYSWIDRGIEFEAEKLYIPRKYEIIRLGDDVYPVYGEVPYQVTNIERPYDAFELSTKGIVMNSRNAKSTSLVQRAIPPYLQFIWIKHTMNKELAKYQGAIQSIDIDQIPDNIGEDLYGNSLRPKLATYLAVLKKTNKDIYSGTQTSYGALPPSTRSPGSDGYLIGTAVELMNLHQLAELVKQEIAMSMGISPQRLASFQQGSNVTDNQQSLQQSYAITEPYFFALSTIWKDAISDWLGNFRTYCETQMRIRGIERLSFQYWLPGNVEEVLDVTPSSLDHTDFGLFLSASANSDTYARLMLQNAQAFAQNQGQGISAISQVLKDIVMQASPEEIHKRIQIIEKQSYDRQTQLQQMTNQSAQELEQMKIAAREDEQAHELLIAREANETKINVATISALGFSKNTDADSDGVPDVVEMQKLILAKEKLNLDAKKHEDTMVIKEKELTIKNKIANKPKSA